MTSNITQSAIYAECRAFEIVMASVVKLNVMAPKKPARDKRSNLSRTFVNFRRKKFSNI